MCNGGAGVFSLAARGRSRAGKAQKDGGGEESVRGDREQDEAEAATTRDARAQR